MQTVTYQNDSDIPRGGMINRAQTYGGGAYSIPSTTLAKKGGDGGNGVIIIWEYA